MAMDRLIEVVEPECSETVEQSNCVFGRQLIVVSDLENGIARIEETVVEEAQQGVRSDSRHRRPRRQESINFCQKRLADALPAGCENGLIWYQRWLQR